MKKFIVAISVVLINVSIALSSIFKGNELFYYTFLIGMIVSTHIIFGFVARYMLSFKEDIKSGMKKSRFKFYLLFVIIGCELFVLACIISANIAPLFAILFDTQRFYAYFQHPESRSRRWIDVTTKGRYFAVLSWLNIITLPFLVYWLNTRIRKRMKDSPFKTLCIGALLLVVIIGLGVLFYLLLIYQSSEYWISG